MRIEKPLFILAGNQFEARDYAVSKSLRLQDWRYIISPLRLKGLRGCNYIKVGSWKNRGDLANVTEELAIQQFKEIAP